MDRAKGKVEAAQEAGPSNISRRFQTVEPERPKSTKAAKAVLAAAEREAKPLAKKAKAKTKPPSEAKGKRGRPIADKPWEAEGVSRMTWYRRQKGK